MLIPSELRNPFPSNSLNRSASSSSSLLPSFSFYRGSSSFSSHLSRLIPHSARVGIQRPHNRLLTHSIFLPHPLSSIRQAHPLSLPLSPSTFGVFFFLPSSSSWPHLSSAQEGEDGGMRSSPFHGRETRLRRKGGVKGGGESSREKYEVEMEERRRRITREVGRHADDKEADTMTGLFSARFEYIGSLWRGMNW